jgi:hypothetical protein
MAKKKMRVSGCGLESKKPYSSRTMDGLFEVNIGDIKRETQKYLLGAQESGVYSIAGLCIELGVTRQTLDAWREGYYATEDLHDDTVTRNHELSDCIEMVLLHIERFWEECDKSAVQSKHVKLLERSGAFEPKNTKGIGTPPFDLGGLSKFAK